MVLIKIDNGEGGRGKVSKDVHLEKRSEETANKVETVLRRRGRGGKDEERSNRDQLVC